jgi:hypothetical protein
MDKLPEWLPDSERPDHDGIESWVYYEMLADFHRARSTFWESRCRLAAGALEAYRNHSVKLPLISADQYITVAKNALDRILPLPAQHTDALKLTT